jgi:2-polyprenyl-3-methyl-5-hydroxy-6-metoxy-1,4-benzoquinol methylase
MQGQGSMRDAAAATELVRKGYNALSWRYRADDDQPADHVAWEKDLISRLRAGAHVVDVGCGCGVPVARDLATAGFAVTGIDISEIQIDRARRLVPDARFIRADVTGVSLPAASFDAVVCLYTIIHVPLVRQRPLLVRMVSWLRPDGWLLITTGHKAWTGTESGWLGGDVDMWWSHADADTYRHWLQEAGLEVIDERFVPEGDSGHELFLARRPSGVVE